MPRDGVGIFGVLPGTHGGGRSVGILRVLIAMLKILNDGIISLQRVLAKVF